VNEKVSLVCKKNSGTWGTMPTTPGSSPLLTAQKCVPKQKLPKNKNWALFKIGRFLGQVKALENQRS